MPTGQEENNEGWGGLIGIGVIILAVWVTMVLVRGLSREARERDEAELSRESRDDGRQPAGNETSETNDERRKSKVGRETGDKRREAVGGRRATGHG